ncbi:MAG: DUF2314 domain-containing protein [Planctomycetota bacterium]|nr:DUF2314 domain-containing protein [Planctomycetota bacterium]
MTGTRASNLLTMQKFFQISMTWIVAIAWLLAGGCTDSDANRSTVIVQAAPEPGSAWNVVEDSIVVALNVDEIDDELEAAMAVAIASADVERENWRYSSPEQKKRWAIKWAAPTIENQIEFLWVRPVAWSPHRIEAVLSNTPLNELLCGKTKGDYVSFPIEEMADWIRYLNENFQGEFEGGFTVKVLSDRYGSPPA